MQTRICLGETPHPRLSFKVPRLRKAVPSHQQEPKGRIRREASGKTKPQNRFAGLSCVQPENAAFSSLKAFPFEHRS